jgi:hypothetical protein
MHLRKLVPLGELLEQLGSAGGAAPRIAAPRPAAARTAPSRTAPVAAPPPRTAASAVAPPARTAAPSDGPSRTTASAVAPAAAPLKDLLLAEIRSAKAFFYNTVVAQAQRIEVGDDRVTFTFLPTHRALREQFEQTRAWLEAAAERLAGRRMTVTAVQAAPAPPGPEEAGEAADPVKADAAKRDLKAEAMSSAAVQAMLEVFPAEIRDVEEM